MEELREKSVPAKLSNRLQVGGKQIGYTAFYNGHAITGKFSSRDKSVIVDYTIDPANKLMRINGVLLDFFRGMGNQSNKDKAKALADSGLLEGILRFANLNAFTLQVPEEVRKMADEKSQIMQLGKVTVITALLRV